VNANFHHVNGGGRMEDERTKPSTYDPGTWRKRLLEGPPPRRTVVKASG
jgi:hypothetical protein